MPLSNNKKMPWTAVLRRAGAARASKEQTKAAALGRIAKNNSNNKDAVVSATAATGQSKGNSNARALLGIAKPAQEIPHSSIIDDAKSDDNKIHHGGAANARSDALLKDDDSLDKDKENHPPAPVQSRAPPPKADDDAAADRLSLKSLGITETPTPLAVSGKNTTTSGTNRRKCESTSSLARWEQEVLPRVVAASSPPPSPTRQGLLQRLVQGHASRPHAQDHSSSMPHTKTPQPLETMTSMGLKVTIIDWNLKIFVVDMVPHDTCDNIIQFTKEHIRRVEARGETEKSWRMLYTYTKMDLPASEVPGLGLIMHRLMYDVTRIVGDLYGKPYQASFLRPRSWKEPHLLNYQKVQGKDPHTGIPMHYDGCHITFQLMLSNRKEYQGGGTYFRALQKTVMLRKGQVLIHPGELYHKGCDITFGFRQLVVCFMDGFDPEIVDESTESEDDERFESNLVEF